MSSHQNPEIICCIWGDEILPSFIQGLFHIPLQGSHHEPISISWNVMLGFCFHCSTLPPIIMVQWKMGVSPILVSFHLGGPIFHVHDYGRKGKCFFLPNIITPMSLKKNNYPRKLTYLAGISPCSIPIGFMYGIFTYIYHKNQPFM